VYIGEIAYIYVKSYSAANLIVYRHIGGIIPPIPP
jgi:hypothetical protein